MLDVLDTSFVLLSLVYMLCLVGLLMVHPWEPSFPYKKTIQLKDAAVIYYVLCTDEWDHPLFEWWIKQFILPFLETQDKTVLVLCIHTSVPEWLWFHPSIYVHRYNTTTQNPLSTLSPPPSCPMIHLNVFDLIT
jgi:hypothetical protein